MKDNQEAICEALAKDFHRAPSETRNYELVTGLNELLYTMTQLHKWSKPLPVDALPINLKTNPVYIERIPVGTVLVISAFNYPFLFLFHLLQVLLLLVILLFSNHLS